MINGIERVGIYGGTFAPIHNGHISAAKAFLEQMKLDKLLIIPTLIPPHKSIDLSDDPIHRFRMCELAFEKTSNIIVSNIELERKGPSYTVDTLRELTQNNRKLFLLCGTDMMLTFDKWREFEEIFKLCCPVYMRRENDSCNDQLIISKNNEYYSKYGVAFRKIVGDPIVISSTRIREAISAQEDVSEYLPENVYEYIISNKLYV